jgi:serine/threonine protein kinase
MKGLLAALDYVHSRGLIHRDVKVNALRFRGSDQASLSSGPVLYDFGHCCRAATEEKTIVGTASYMAPEVARVYGISQKAAYDSKVDLWAAGVILYVLLVGDFPWKLEGPRVVHQKELRSALDALQSVSENARVFCTKLLERDPEKRLSASDARGAAWFLDEDISLKVNHSAFMVARAANRFKKAVKRSDTPEAGEVSASVFLPGRGLCGLKCFAIVGCCLCLSLLAYTFSLTFKLKPHVVA